MRLLELLVVVLISALALVMIWGPRPKKNGLKYSLLALYAVTVAQLFIEGYRWQMIPGYAILLILTVVILLKNKSRQRTRKKRYVIACLLTLIWMLSTSVMVAIPALLPVFSFHQPSGPYSVGTTVYHFIDHERADEYSSDATARRELMVQFWYPSEPQTGTQTSPYIHNVSAITKGLEQALSFPAWTLSHLNLIKTHSYPNAQLSSAEHNYPVLIFSHGMTGFRNQNTFQVEELASHGYIVAAIDHPYDAAATVYPDGREIMIQMKDLSGFEEFDAHMQLWTEDVTFKSA